MKTRQKRTGTKTKLKWWLLSLVLLSVTAGFLYYQYLPYLPESVPDQIVLTEISPTADEEWWEDLAHGKIVNVIPWNPYGLSEKLQITLASGRKAGVKLCEPFSLWEKAFPTVDFNTRELYEKLMVRRAWGVHQGYNELAAFYVDRALRQYKKPPTAGRYITNKMLYANDDRFLNVLLRMLPTFRIPVVLIAWYDGIKVAPPPIELRDVMVHKKPVEVGGRMMERAAQVSDCMIFDYIMDDHDRVEEHNWLVDRNGRYIFWDSGLSFRYGPMGNRERDMEVFCGRRGWKGGQTFDRKCVKIQMFRKRTVDALRKLEVTEQPLSMKVKQEMKKDPLFPIVNFGLFYAGRTKYPRVKYEFRNFMEGFDKRVREILKYVDEVIKIHESDDTKVLIKDSLFTGPVY